MMIASRLSCAMRAPRHGEFYDGMREMQTRGETASKTEIAQARMVVGAPAKRPMIFALAGRDGQVVDAGDAALHESQLVEFPILIPVGAKPVAAVIVPLIRKSHRD